MRAKSTHLALYPQAPLKALKTMKMPWDLGQKPLPKSTCQKLSPRRVEALSSVPPGILLTSLPMAYNTTLFSPRSFDAFGMKDTLGDCAAYAITGSQLYKPLILKE
jgi:hypothetical protein